MLLKLTFQHVSEPQLKAMPKRIIHTLATFRIPNCSIKMSYVSDNTTSYNTTSNSTTSNSNRSTDKVTVGDGRVFVISDLHVDIPANKEFVYGWSSENYRNDALIVAGDVTDDLCLLQETLAHLQGKFAQVSFVPGNHELWIRPKHCEEIGYKNSIEKFHKILSLCDHLGVHTQPSRFSTGSSGHVWIVPLFSWYAGPEEDPEDSLYIKHQTIPEDRSKDIYWMDNTLCKWPELDLYGITKSKYFASLNDKYLDQVYDDPVISFSHMVPKRELILPVQEDVEAMNKERHQNGLGDAPDYKTPIPGFNFTRYAGANIISKQVEKLGSVVHVHGHQHRNRDRMIGATRWVSHCLGNLREQKESWTYGLSKWKGPKQVWPSHQCSI